MAPKPKQADGAGIKTQYSITELVAMKLPSLPGSRQNMRLRADRDGWPFMEVKSRGSRGIKREYAVPAYVLELIADKLDIAIKKTTSTVSLKLTVTPSEAAYIEMWLKNRRDHD